jgi:hypothetical protein
VFARKPMGIIAFSSPFHFMDIQKVPNLKPAAKRKELAIDTLINQLGGQVTIFTDNVILTLVYHNINKNCFP